jgi:hypothetical protein
MNAPTPVLSRETSTIPGWGVDADPANDPTYPYRDRSKDDGLRMDWPRPAVQRPDVEILQSIEHLRQPAVVGTSTPPRGLSGVIRRGAFRYSESNWMHWLMLMGADRVNVVEGILEDLAHARIPNIPAEMGVRAEWRHNKKGLATKTAVIVGLSALAYALIRGSRGGSGQSASAAGAR